MLSADAEQLLFSVQGTAERAAHISGRIRSLDMARGNAQATLETIDLVLNRSNAVHGVQVRAPAATCGTGSA